MNIEIGDIYEREDGNNALEIIKVIERDEMRSGKFNDEWRVMVLTSKNMVGYADTYDITNYYKPITSNHLKILKLKKVI